MRDPLHLGLILCLLVSFAQAPLMHAHVGLLPGHQHDDGSSAHLHLPASPSHTPSITTCDPDEGTQLIEWLAGDGTSISQLPFSLHASHLSGVLLTCAGVCMAQEEQAHDPPRTRTLPSRAPPSLYSAA